MAATKNTRKRARQRNPRRRLRPRPNPSRKRASHPLRSSMSPMWKSWIRPLPHAKRSPSQNPKSGSPPKRRSCSSHRRPLRSLRRAVLPRSSARSPRRLQRMKTLTSASSSRSIRTSKRSTAKISASSETSLFRSPGAISIAASLNTRRTMSSSTSWTTNTISSVRLLRIL